MVIDTQTSRHTDRKRETDRQATTHTHRKGKREKEIETGRQKERKKRKSEYSYCMDINKYAGRLTGRLYCENAAAASPKPGLFKLS